MSYIVNQKGLLNALTKRIEQLEQKNEYERKFEGYEVNFEVLSSQIHPQCEPWQHWKKAACDIINPNQKVTIPFGCFDTNCRWQNKNVGLNAYIEHLKSRRETGHSLKMETTRYLPKQCVAAPSSESLSE